MVLRCPACGFQHVDAPEPEKGWTNPPHKSHLCHRCGFIWRPADVPTTGVLYTVTRGAADHPLPSDKLPWSPRAAPSAEPAGSPTDEERVRYIRDGNLTESIETRIRAALSAVREEEREAIAQHFERLIAPGGWSKAAIIEAIRGRGAAPKKDAP